MLFLSAIAGLMLAQRADILIEDFESETYGDWHVEGTAFGPGPAEGTLPSQLLVNGFEGERLVNSYFQGDNSLGRLTSPPFELKRPYITFLVGGGAYEGKTCINLLHKGKVVRTATGPNIEPGGGEQLALASWEIEDLAGESVQIEIVDQQKGTWGHINVDQIVQTDVKPKVPVLGPQEKSFTVAEPYLVLPIKNAAQKTVVKVEVDGKAVRQYDVELATDPEDVDWYAYFTISGYEGQAARVTAEKATVETFALVRQTDTVPGSENWYKEELRPQLHFTQAVGWNNDPNGMVYLAGEWHLFFQHNPVGWSWGNMTWGHAVSEDLVHWKQLPNVLFPKTMAVDACFSGGGLIDTRNRAGWKTGDNDVLVAFLTDTGAGEAIAYSNDRGRTFTWYEGNPVIKHTGRDPKVIWYEYESGDDPISPTAKHRGGHWVMAVYDEHPEHKANIALYTSDDLKDWAVQSHLPGYYECPELFELAIDGGKETRWVAAAADAKYAIGSFDGQVFTPDHEGKHQVQWGDGYAAQTFSNAPDGRRIQMSWARIASPGMPFNQTFSFPHELSLRTTPEGVRMFAEPVQELSTLYQGQFEAKPGEWSIPVDGELYDVTALIRVGDAERVGLSFGADEIVYEDGKLNGADLLPLGGFLKIRVIIDRTMVEIFANDGRVYITAERKQKGVIDSISVFAEGGEAELISLTGHELKSIWRD